jgi:Asp-tRNA(Asn)/Glu-tRNA(Gln) amidotransferase B subunit
LVLYYKNKTQEQEWSFLLMQINNEKILKQTVDKYKNEIQTREQVLKDKYLELLNSHEKSVNVVNNIINKKNKEIEKLKNKNNKVTNKKG